MNVWEFDWPGGDRAVAVVSAEPSEGAWFDATVAVIDTVTGAARTVMRPTGQVACPRLSGDDRTVAVIHGRSSDRGFVAGEVVVTSATGEPVAALDLDASWIQWTPDGRIAFAGWHGCGAACGYAALDGAVEPVWSGELAIAPGRAPSISAEGGVIAAVTEGPGVPARCACTPPAGGRSWRFTPAPRWGRSAGGRRGARATGSPSRACC